MTKLLKFGRGNAYLSRDIATFSLPSGWTCPGALECLSRADRVTGKVTDVPSTLYRCYQVSMEAVYPSLRKMVWHNLDLLRGKSYDKMRDLILASLPSWAKTFRIHVGGDFFCPDYFFAWCEVAQSRPHLLFYAFTKSIPYWNQFEADIPANMILTASDGGRYDDQIKDSYKRAVVVFTKEHAAMQGLEIDYDDSHAYSGTESFALLLHGTQPKGSKAASALRKLKHHERTNSTTTQDT